MDSKQLKERTQNFALNVIEFVEGLPKTKSGDVLGKQLLRSACSVGANYRAACRAKSSADMINKMKIVEEESDETQYWLELLVEAGLVPHNQITNIYTETEEILAMTVASIKTLRTRKS